MLDQKELKKKNIFALKCYPSEHIYFKKLNLFSEILKLTYMFLEIMFSVHIHFFFIKRCILHVMYLYMLMEFIVFSLNYYKIRLNLSFLQFETRESLI